MIRGWPENKPKRTPLIKPEIGLNIIPNMQEILTFIFVVRYNIKLKDLWLPLSSHLTWVTQWWRSCSLWPFPARPQRPQWGKGRQSTGTGRRIGTERGKPVKDEIVVVLQFFKSCRVLPNFSHYFYLMICTAQLNYAEISACKCLFTLFFSLYIL